MNRRVTNSLVSVAQSAEAADLKSAQCGFKSHRRHMNRKKKEIYLEALDRMRNKRRPLSEVVAINRLIERVKCS